MPRVVLVNSNGSLKITSNAVILETPDDDSTVPDESSTLTFQQKVQDSVVHLVAGSFDFTGVQWVDYLSVPLYSNVECTTPVGLLYFKDESVGISYGDVSNIQMVRETATFLISNGTRHSMIEYTLAFAGSSVNFSEGDTYHASVSSNSDTANPKASLNIDDMTVVAGANVRTLSLKSGESDGSYGLFTLANYYWQSSDFGKSNEYTYSNSSMVSVGAASAKLPPPLP